MTADTNNVEVILDKMDTTAAVDNAIVTVKTPKRILHFSDGTLEEYSDEEVEPKTEAKQEAVIDPKTLTWGPWMSYMLWAAGTSTVAACDYVGEALASAFGITTPKYYFEAEEFKRRQAAELKLEESRKGWCDAPQDGTTTLVTKEHGASASGSVSSSSIVPGATVANTAVGAVADV